jgi:hypothetical protein
MNLYTLTKLIQELEQIKNPTSYDLKVLKYYKEKKSELINRINEQIKSFEFGNKSFKL